MSILVTDVYKTAVMIIPISQQSMNQIANKEGDRMDERYNVRVEFEKYSKQFEKISMPEVIERSNHSELVVKDRNRTYVFNLSFVHFWTSEIVR